MTTAERYAVLYGGTTEHAPATASHGCGHPNHGGEGHDCGPFTPPVSERIDSDVIERAARAMADDWNPDRDPILTAMFRDYANTLAASGLLAPIDETRAWVCGVCGHSPEAHGMPQHSSYQCVYQPILTSSDTFASTKPSDADVAERIAEAWDEGYQAHEDEYWCGDGENPYRATPPETPGFEGTRSALDGLTIRKEQPSD